MSEKKKEEKEVRATDRTEDAFDVFRETCVSCIDESAKLIPQYSQSVTNLQNECINACKNMAESSITLTKEFTETTWGPGRFPSSMVKNASDMTEAFLKVMEINNKAAIAGIDATKENVRVLSDNIDTFAKINSNLIKTWQSFLAPKA